MLYSKSPSYAVKPTKYQIDKANVASNQKVKNPDGTDPSVVSESYADNHNIETSKLKKAEDLENYISDSALSSMGGIRTKKQLMTYQNYYNAGYTTGLRHDIDPNRLVWVVQLKLSNAVELRGYSIKKTVITSMYDAQTGALLEDDIASEDPHGMDEVKAAHQLQSSQSQSNK